MALPPLANLVFVQSELDVPELLEAIHACTSTDETDIFLNLEGWNLDKTYSTILYLVIYLRHNHTAYFVDLMPKLPDDFFEPIDTAHMEDGTNLAAIAEQTDVANQVGAANMNATAESTDEEEQHWWPALLNASPATYKATLDLLWPDPNDLPELSIPRESIELAEPNTSYTDVAGEDCSFNPFVQRHADYSSLRDVLEDPNIPKMAFEAHQCASALANYGVKLAGLSDIGELEVIVHDTLQQKGFAHPGHYVTGSASMRVYFEEKLLHLQREAEIGFSATLPADSLSEVSIDDLNLHMLRKVSRLPLLFQAIDSNNAQFATI